MTVARENKAPILFSLFPIGFINSWDFRTNFVLNQCLAKQNGNKHTVSWQTLQLSPWLKQSTLQHSHSKAETLMKNVFYILYLIPTNICSAM